MVKDFNSILRVYGSNFMNNIVVVLVINYMCVEMSMTHGEQGGISIIFYSSLLCLFLFEGFE